MLELRLTDVTMSAVDRQEKLGGAGLDEAGEREFRCWCADWPALPVKNEMMKTDDDDEAAAACAQCGQPAAPSWQESWVGPPAAA